MSKGIINHLFLAAAKSFSRCPPREKGRMTNYVQSNKNNCLGIEMLIRALVSINWSVTKKVLSVS